MEDFYNSSLIQSIKDKIKTNNNKDITGNILQEELLKIVSALDLGGMFLGFASKSTNPVNEGKSRANGFYFSTEEGTYTNFIGSNNQSLVIGSDLEIIYREVNNDTLTWNHRSIASQFSVSGEEDNFASLDGNGGLQDSGYKADDFATAAQGALADTAYQKPQSGIPSTDLTNAVQTLLGKADTALQPTDVKTINNQSIVGSGNITIEGGGTNDYTDLENKPQINSFVLSGNKSASDLGLATAAQGTKADTAVQQVMVGTTTTGEAGTNASVTNSGTQTAPILNFTIPRGENGKDGQDAVNPFKGYFNSLSDLQSKYHTGEAGDFVNVYDSTANKTYRYIWDASLATPAWAQALDSSNNPIEVTPSTATFNSGENVVDVSIVDLETGGSANVPNAESVKQLNEKLYGVPSGQVEEVENDLAMTDGNKLHCLISSTRIRIYASTSSQDAWTYEINIEGMSKIRIYPNPNTSTKAAYIVILNNKLPKNTGSSNIDYGPEELSGYIATGCDGYTPDSDSTSSKMTIRMTDTDVSETGYHEITLSSQAKYLYVSKTVSYNSGYLETTPAKIAEVISQPIPSEVGDIYKLDERIDALEDGGLFDNQLRRIASPCIPALHNYKVDEQGNCIESEDTLTTDIVCGDFFVSVGSSYRIKRAILFDENGKVVNYNLVFNTGEGPNTTIPFGTIDSSTYATSFGKAQSINYCGIALEIQHKDNTSANPITISPQDAIITVFIYNDGNLKSELLTSSDFNGQVASDTSGQLVYEKQSVINLLKRVKTCTTIDWPVIRSFPCTQYTNQYRDHYYLQGSRQIGVPYSRSSVRERWFGLDVSPTTFISAANNPYSVLYTEQIGASGTDYPFHSEYGISSYGASNGVPYYGLVCSAYASYIMGLSAAIQTSNMANNSYTIKLKEVGYGAEQAALNAMEIPPLSLVTTPSHTYIVLDFLLNEFGERVCAIVVEETYPNVKATLYRVFRLQTRFNGDYSKVLSNQDTIQLSVPKPSQLYNHREKNIWNKTKTYGILHYYDYLYGDNNVMFYMGDKAVVMKYDTTNYAKNDACWLIVKPEDVYTTVQVEKYDNTTGTWSNVGSKTIATDKQSYSDNNTDYYKIDVTSLCNTKGKYRAYLTDGTNNTSYTEWIVLDVSLYKDGNRIKWTVNNDDSSEGDDDYVTVVAANRVTSVGQPYSGLDTVEETNASNGYVDYLNSSDISARIVCRCNYGTASRYKVMTTFS